MGYCCFILLTNTDGIKITEFGVKYGKGFQTPTKNVPLLDYKNSHELTDHQPIRHEITISCYLETFHIEFHLSA